MRRRGTNKLVGSQITEEVSMSAIMTVIANMITPSLIVALLALWIAFSNYRRNNFVVLRVRDYGCSYPQSVRENDCQPFCQLRVVIQNLGIPLHNLHMSLCFSSRDG